MSRLTTALRQGGPSACSMQQSGNPAAASSTIVRLWHVSDLMLEGRPGQLERWPQLEQHKRGPTLSGSTCRALPARSFLLRQKHYGGQARGEGEDFGRHVYPGRRSVRAGLAPRLPRAIVMSSLRDFRKVLTRLRLCLWRGGRRKNEPLSQSLSPSDGERDCTVGLFPRVGTRGRGAVQPLAGMIKPALGFLSWRRWY